MCGRRSARVPRSRTGSAAAAQEYGNDRDLVPCLRGSAGMKAPSRAASVPGADGEAGAAEFASFPRVPLVLGPTPLHPAPRLSSELGVPVLLKRDDLAGVG